MITTRFHSERGFTIVELMITVVIIGIAAAMAVPHLQKAYERLKFRSTVRDINSTLRMARSKAITDKNQYGVYFQTDGEHLSVTLFKDVTNLNSPDFVTGDTTVRVDTLPIEFVWMWTDAPNNVVAFRPNGSCALSGSGNIYSMAYDDQIVALSMINVLGSTGRVSSSSYVY